ncbi:MAG: cation:proton antiporter [Candidatus Hodarchaeales archaeon]|jgi:Kef-type K+ transport system membrane component KefB
MADIATTLMIELGAILFLGIFGALILKKYGIPQVLGLLLMGLMIGIAFDFFDAQTAKTMELLAPVVALALGFIGFNIGHELDFKTIRKLDPKIFIILVCEAFGALILVAFLVYIITQDVPLALIFGALASATAPAATADVVWEYKASGPLTTTILAILVLDDVLAIILIDIALEISLSIYGNGSLDLLSIILDSLYHSLASCLLGMVAGGGIAVIVARVKDPIDALELVFGTLIALIGIASLLDLSLILASMIYGTMAESLTEADTKELFHQIFRLGSPIIAIFFILVGMRANIAGFIAIGLIGSLYIFGRSTGKIAGAWVGSRAASSPDCVQKYLGFCLFSQAGVALALAVVVFEKFDEIGGEAADAGILVLETITATTLVVQFIGPLLVKWALHQAEEAEVTPLPAIVPFSEEDHKHALEILEEECIDEEPPRKPPPIR